MLASVVAIATATAGDRRDERLRMVATQIEARGITDPAVLTALRSVPRHRFVPAAVRPDAYTDSALPIGYEQTISQPYIVAAMTEAARLTPGSRILEIGTGSGYQAAVASRIVREVYSIELLPELTARAAKTLADLGYHNIQTRTGDGYQGWPEEAPFDAILVTAAAPIVPQALLDQLADGGRLVIPVGPSPGVQELQILSRQKDGRIHTERRFPVRFVPLRHPTP
jgi:protein-L-isoaspartate(D-aspartate) O-methyltransferase